tara:strand:+ start:10265 stop:10657 length:393 start_codon:yes stop_codon:yes gene_type:complete
MKALLGKCFSILLFYTVCSVTTAQDVGVARINNAKPLHPAVALEMRIQSYIDALAISGEQEPGFRTALQQVADLESAYLDQSSATSSEFSNDEALLAASEKLLSLILYPTQVTAFRELEQEHLWQLRGQP